MLCKNATNEDAETISIIELFKLAYEPESISSSTVGVPCHAEL